jgi:hypothetical protein
MNDPSMLHVFLIWLIPASIELAIGAFFVYVARDKPQKPSRE